MSLEIITVISFLRHQDPNGSISKVMIVLSLKEPLLKEPLPCLTKECDVLRKIQISKVCFKNRKKVD